MKPCDVLKLQKSYYEDPSFFVEYCNVGRGFTKVNNDDPRIISTTVILVWKIIGEELLPVESIGVFFNNETYLIQWDFKYKLINNEIKTATIFFYWKGINATKGLSPIPEKFNNDNAIVERIVQWSEPAVFFHIFPKPIIVINNINLKTQLFMIRGELDNEIHLYELPYLKKNLRSRGAFLIINKNIYLWRGSKITKELDVVIKKINFCEILNNDVVIEINENDEDHLFEFDNSKYYHVEQECNFTPRLFYMNSITGEFLATEIEYPLRNKNSIAAFPFLQTHLYTDQPGLFLLDNNHEIWLIWNESDIDKELYNLGKKTANEYAKLLENNYNKHIPVRFIQIDTDIIEFTNIFPYWN